MKFLDERKEIISYGKLLLDSGLTPDSGGNISVFLRDFGLMAITPSGIPYYEIQPQDIAIMNLDGTVVDGAKKPSSEYELHQLVYKNRTDVNAIVHFHSVYTSILACLEWELPAIHYLVAKSGGSNVRCAKYGTFGTKELAENTFEALKDRYAVFLANHGALTCGETLSKAFNVSKTIEFCSEIFYRAKSIGEPTQLPNKEIDILLDLFESYGQQ
jgi:L-fuculose-phosphate aldolase